MRDTNSTDVVINAIMLRLTTFDAKNMHEDVAVGVSEKVYGMLQEVYRERYGEDGIDTMTIRGRDIVKNLTLPDDIFTLEIKCQTGIKRGTL